MPLFTIVTVCYNAADLLPDTIESVLSQSCSDMIEYIIIDGASTDQTPQVLQRYKGRINQVVSEPDHGIYDAMNKGTRLANGEYTLMLNAGDRLYSPETIRNVAERLKAHPETRPDVVYGDVAKAGIVKKAEAPHNSHRMYFCHQCVFVRTDVLKCHPFDTHHHMSADFKLFKQLWAEHAVFLQLDIPIAHFDTHGVSNTQRIKGIRDNISVVKEIDHGYERWKILSKLYIQVLLCQLRSCLKHKK